MIEAIEREYPIGSDITIFNTYYNRPVYENSDGSGPRKKISDDFIILVYKDNQTKEKHYKIIKKPEYTYYKLKKGEKVPDYNKLFIEKSKVDPVTVPFLDIEKSIADQTGNVEFFKTNIANRNAKENKKLHTHPAIFFSDVDIENHYRFKFANMYTNNIEKLFKSFFDIEVDGKFAAGDFVQMGECPINCVSFYDEKSDTIYTFALRDKRNPLIEKFEDELRTGSFNYNDIRNFIIDAVGGYKAAKKYKILDTKFKINFYDYEIELIKDLFITIHSCSPDFVEGWNSSAFDIEYIIERIKVLGYDPADIMCDPRWEIKVVNNYIDVKNINNLAERGDNTFISGLPVFIDQMIQYASRRKSKIGSFKSFKLDDIGLREAQVQKLDYHHITNSVTELPWLDFKTFVLYNIMDVVVQKCIEIKTNDLEYIFSKCVVNNTVYKKGHRQTVYLINRMAADFYKEGYIIGNNCNRWNEKPPKFLGALVGDPTHTNNYSKLNIDGRPIWICDNLQDYDYKSLYPSITLENNIAPNTQVGKIIIDEKVYDHENLYNIDKEKYSRGGEFIENLVTDNIIEYCKRWFHLAGIEEFLQDIDELIYSRYKRHSNLRNAGFNCNPLIDTLDTVESPISFNAPNKEVVIKFGDRREVKPYERSQSTSG